MDKTEALDHIQNMAVEFGKIVKEKRKAKGLSMKVLSELSGVSLTAVVDLENGRYMPRVDILLKIGDVLDIAPSSIYPQIISGKGVSYEAPTIKSLGDMILKEGLSVQDTKEVLEFIQFKKWAGLKRRNISMHC